VLFKDLAGDTAGARIIPAMAGIDGNAKLLYIQHRRLSPDPDDQLSAAAVIGHAIAPVLRMFQLYIYPKDIVFHLLIPRIPDLFGCTKLRDPVGIARHPVNIHRNPRRAQQLRSPVRIPVVQIYDDKIGGRIPEDLDAAAEMWIMDNRTIGNPGLPYQAALCNISIVLVGEPDLIVHAE